MWFWAIVVGIICAVIIEKDAKSRGMDSTKWAVFTLLLAIVAVPMYLVVREPKIIGGNSGGPPVITICSRCGTRGWSDKSVCSACMGSGTMIPIDSPRGQQLVKELAQ